MVKVSSKVVAMVKCLLCRKEFKNDAGLSGHMRFSHPSAVNVDGHKVEVRLEAMEADVHELSAWMHKIHQAYMAMHENAMATSDLVHSLNERQGSDADILLKAIRAVAARVNDLDDKIKKEVIKR